MSDRKREVETHSFIYFVCDVHGWDYTEIDGEDVCPVCFGESLAETRIVKSLEGIMADRIAKSEGRPVSPTVGVQEVIALIKRGK